MPNPKNIEKYKYKKGKKPTGGRPKGARNLSTILNEFLDCKIDYTDETGATTKIPAREAVIMSLIRGATHGDIKFIREILDRTEGKALQKTEISNADSLAPVVQIVNGLPD